MRKFVPFDPVTILREFQRLSRADYQALKHAMGKYAQSEDEILPPAMVEDQHKYGEKYKPLVKVRHRNGNHAGRAFFYRGPEENGVQAMIVLLVYKKESDEAPQRLLEAAYQRMVRHRGNR